MVPVIQKHGGSNDKFMGDGIMATFDAAVRTNSYAADALAAVQELADASEAWRQERIDEGKQGLDVGFAVAVGPVVFGAVGDRTRLEFTVIGDAVNLAAKLEKHTRDEGVRGLTTANCIAIASEQGYKSLHTLELRSQRQVAGVNRPLDLVVLASGRDDAARSRHTSRDGQDGQDGKVVYL